MYDNHNLILILAAGFSLALTLGYVTERLRLSPILGYLIAGIAVGPYTPGFVADLGLASQLAEIGVILLMFGVGLHFHLKDLLAVRTIAISGATGQIVASTVLGTIVGVWFGLSTGAGVILGLAASVASTVVLIKMLTNSNELETQQGQIAVGWLVVEDIFTVVILVMLPALAVEGDLIVTDIAGDLFVATAKLVVLASIILVLGAKLIPWLLVKVARIRSRELFTLTVLAVAIAVASTSAILFNASFALGAFLAGMVVGQSKVGHQAAADAMPMRDAFAVLFFISIGMLFDPRFVVDHPVFVLAMVGVVMIVKPVVAYVIMWAFGHSIRASLVLAVSLSQIGEFTFILSSSALKLNLISIEAQSALIAASLISISLNPLLFDSTPRLERWLESKPRLWKSLNARISKKMRALEALVDDPKQTEIQSVEAVVVGYGPVGRTVTRILSDFGMRPTVIETNIDTVDALSRQGIRAIYGNASHDNVLTAAGVQRAQFLIVTIPDLASRSPVIRATRQLNKSINILSRARYLAERTSLSELGVTEVCYEEVEAAVGLSEFVLQHVGVNRDLLELETARIRAEFSV